MRRELSRKPTLANPLPFLRGWSRNPVAVGWPFATSYWTARRLALATLAAAVPGDGHVLELGPGTGPTTQALIELGCPAARIVVVERDGELCRLLERRFAGLCVVQGDALRLREVLGRAGIGRACAVLSGLPMRTVAPADAARCYRDAFRAMPPGGAIIQYTYGFRPSVDPDAGGLKLEATFLGREWRNMPPMAIWRYRLPAHHGNRAGDNAARTMPAGPAHGRAIP